jgi:peptidoglycan hydrolase-like protein with peptidoglycan-binding domain
MFLKNNFKIISASILLIVLFFGISHKVKSITAADIEMLIGLGLIPTQSADSARALVNKKSATMSNPGAIITSTSSSVSGCLVLNQNIVKGMSGTTIAAIQRFLKSEGYFPSNQDVTNFFGDVTQKAVADFQVAQGLIKTSSQAGAGTLGPITREKIQEISCGRLAEENAVIASTTTATLLNPFLNNQNSTEKATTYDRPFSIVLQAIQKTLDVERGIMALKYELKVYPSKGASYMEVVALCDPSSINLISSRIKECGKTYEISPIRKGQKSFNLTYQNKSSRMQSVNMAIEVFDEYGQSLGVTNEVTEVPGAKPVVKIEIGNQTFSQFGVGSITTRQCTRDQQLEFIRYSMSPYDPENPVSLPICWPGELLCNRSNPPTFCRIVDGPNSDDLCMSSQQFLNGKCVPRI